MARRLLLASFVLTAALGVACGAAAPRERSASSSPVAHDIAGATPLHGPFATWEEICGAPVARDPDAAPAADDPMERYARCSVRATPLAAGGPFVALATYHEGSPFEGSSYLALRTVRGWFVVEVPDGAPFGGGLSHHTPSSLAFDAQRTRFEDGALRVVSQGHASMFIPGRGAEGSTRDTWTAVQRCGLRDDIVVCTPPEQVYRESCRRGEGCERQGEDVL